MLLYNTDWLFYHILWPYWLCALEKDCIAPSDQLHCDDERLKDWNSYAGCHRYDQTIINILLLNAYNGNSNMFVAEKYFFDVRRWVTDRHEPKIC